MLYTKYSDELIYSNLPTVSQEVSPWMCYAILNYIRENRGNIDRIKIFYEDILEEAILAKNNFGTEDDHIYSKNILKEYSFNINEPKYSVHCDFSRDSNFVKENYELEPMTAIFENMVKLLQNNQILLLERNNYPVLLLPNQKDKRVMIFDPQQKYFGYFQPFNIVNYLLQDPTTKSFVVWIVCNIDLLNISSEVYNKLL
jgi:hypothetical protein